MNTLTLVLLAALSAIAVIIITILLCTPSKDSPKASGKDGEGISVSAAEGSIVTVRKVGRMTSVTIRSTVHDHWEGADNIQVPMIPIEVTRLEKPDLYAEYISPETSAIRKYEIADDLYAEGFTLPYIRGLNEQYKKEVAEAMNDSASDGRTIVERTPVNLTGRGKEKPLFEELNIDDGLRHAPLSDMGEESVVPEIEQ